MFRPLHLLFPHTKVRQKGNCWGNSGFGNRNPWQQLLSRTADKGNKSVASWFVWRSEQQPSRARGGLFVHSVIWPSGPFSIPWTSWPWPLAASMAASQPPNLLSCNEHVAPFPNWLCNSPHTLPQRRGQRRGPPPPPADDLFSLRQSSSASWRNPEFSLESWGYFRSKCF